MPILHTDKIRIGNACINVIYRHNFFSDQKPLPRRLHCHINYEIYCIEKGEITVQIENEDKRISGPAVFIIPPGVYHIFKNCPEDSECYLFEFSLTDEGIGRSFQKYSQILAGLATPRLIPTDQLDFGDLRVFETLDEEKRFKLHAKTGMLLIELFNKLKKTADRDADPAAYKKIALQKELMVANIIAYMEKNARGPLSLSDISESLGFSERQIERLLKEVMHDTFFSLLNKYRIKIAAISIDSGETSLTQVAEDCGFSNYVTFWNHFTKLMGMTPSEYKKRVIKK